MTIVLGSHRRIRSGEVSPTLTTKCNVAVLDVYCVFDGRQVAVVGEEMVKYPNHSHQAAYAMASTLTAKRKANLSQIAIGWRVI